MKLKKLIPLLQNPNINVVYENENYEINLIRMYRNQKVLLNKKITQISISKIKRLVVKVE